MTWNRTTDRPDRREWVRADALATVVVRRTGDDRWAVTLDVVEQASDGPAYERRTLDDEDDALALAESWRREYDTED